MPFGYYPLFMQSLTLDLKYHKNRLPQALCMQKINNDIANIPSTREPFPLNFYQSFDVPVVEQQKWSNKNHRVSQKVYQYFGYKTKDRVLDSIAEFFDIDSIRKREAWRTLPLKRMSVFLEWLATDESDLPVLFSGEAPFIQKFVDRLGNY